MRPKMTKRRILVAGIGNIFLGDDAFGVEVVQQLLRQDWPEAVQVTDFGIRGFDLAYALADGYETAILIDALPRGEPAGTLYVIEPEWSNFDEESGLEIETHGMDPVKVLRLVQHLGGQPGRVLVVGCEPTTFGPEFVGQMGLSPPVLAAVGEAVKLVRSLVKDYLQEVAI